MLKGGKKTATLMEVLVGSVLLVSIFATLLVTFVSVRRYIRRANRRLVAVNGSRGVLNSLYFQVAENWDDSGGGLTVGLHDSGSVIIDNENYSASYYVYDTSGDYRRVDVSVNYPD